jgi:hypothetical protein
MNVTVPNPDPKPDLKYIPRAKFEMGKYMLAVIIIWGYSWVIPGILSYYSYMQWIDPNIKNLASITPIFQSLDLFLIVVLSPGVLILLFLLRLFFVVLLSKIGIRWCNWRSPRQEMIGAKGVGKKEARAVNYYHLRGIILRVLKWEITKSPFPWLAPWAFNFVGANKLGRGTILEDHFYCPEYLETGKNVYIGQGAIVSSHLVEGKYGAITLKRVHMEEHTVINAFNPISPGTYFGPYTEFLPMSGVTKFQKVKGFAKYFGLPVSRISTKRYLKLLDIPEVLHPLVYANKQKKALFHQHKQNQNQKQEAHQAEKEQPLSSNPTP